MRIIDCAVMPIEQCLHRSRAPARGLLSIPRDLGVTPQTMIHFNQLERYDCSAAPYYHPPLSWHATMSQVPLRLRKVSSLSVRKPSAYYFDGVSLTSSAEALSMCLASVLPYPTCCV